MTPHFLTRCPTAPTALVRVRIAGGGELVDLASNLAWGRAHCGLAGEGRITHWEVLGSARPASPSVTPGIRRRSPQS